MDPAQEIGVGRGVRRRALRRLVRSGHLAVKTPHPSALAIGRRAITEGDDGQPLGRSGQAAEGIGLVPRVLHDPRERPGMQGLHEQRTHAADDGRKRAVHLPGSRTRAEVADVRAIRHRAHPVGRPIGVSGDDPTKARGDLVAGRLEQGQRRRRHGSRLPRNLAPRILESRQSGSRAPEPGGGSGALVMGAARTSPWPSRPQASPAR